MFTLFIIEVDNLDYYFDIVKLTTPVVKSLRFEIGHIIEIVEIVIYAISVEELPCVGQRFLSRHIEMVFSVNRLGHKIHTCAYNTIIAFAITLDTHLSGIRFVRKLTHKQRSFQGRSL